MATNLSRLYFLVSASAFNDAILYKDRIFIKVCSSGHYEEKPEQLVYLLDLLRYNKDLNTLIEKFPHEAQIIKALQRVLEGGIFKPENVSRLNWDSHVGHSINILLLT